MSSPNWYRLRKYPHFDLPLTADDAVALVTDPDRIARHGFWPFLSFNLKRRRYKFDGKIGIASIKSRPIRIASHRDGYVFAYYAAILAQRYEAFIAGTSLSSAVLAYRKGNGSSLNFAMAAFDEISSRKQCVAFALDLEGFFDSIQHSVLKRQWCAVLGQERLLADHFAVFGAVTRYARIDRDDCLKALGIDPGKGVPRPICSPRDFHDRLRKAKLIKVNERPYGIPQGSPISAVLSNIYMMPFDQKVAGWCSDNDAYYRRYCDDILIIAPPDKSHLVLDMVAGALQEQGSRLQINPAKTTQTHFAEGGHAGPILQYLGFTFDGKNKLIRSQTLSRFWRRVIYGVRAAKKRARKSIRSGGDGRLFKRKLYRRFSHLGKANFITYAKRAWKLSGSQTMQQQLRRHWKRLHEEIER